MWTPESEVNDLGCSPGEMISHPAPHQYHPSPQSHKTLPQNHPTTTESVQQRSSLSPSTNILGSVAINPIFTAHHDLPILEQIARAYTESNTSADSIQIPRSAFSPPIKLSPSKPENKNIFSGNYAEAKMMFVGQETFSHDIFQPNATGARATWEPRTSSDLYSEARLMYYTQSNDVSAFGSRRSSIYYPRVLSRPKWLT